MLLVGAVLIDISNYMYEKTFVTGITLRSPQTVPLMILVFISASLWGCLGCDKLPDGNIFTEPEEDITFSFFNSQTLN